ncbi:hypothetical protein NEAUS04_0810 [Nematocida ausubeli]|nr:hypothetical protein NEAUS07_0941 [Nematocida ausubeli]KAI5147772.1 hypothetical protein NEAUS05_1059 [Nematocida ausubeli]KAI5161972.1 hypothetical protein NEAUS04_0810 [Nematocida ausubeli]
MRICVQNECCLRILSFLNVLKTSPLQKIELENILCEINRLITIVTAKQDIPSVEIERVSERKFVIKNTHIEKEEAGVKIEKTDILELKAYFEAHPIDTLEEAAEYIKVLYENRICIVCLRRACAITLTAPLVVRRVNGSVFVYHTECVEEGKRRRLYPTE